MKIIIITYSYAPQISPRAFRWSAIAEQWVKQGHHVDIVCAWSPDLLKYEVLNAVNVHRAGMGLSKLVRSILSRKKKVKSVSGTNDRNVHQKDPLINIGKFIHDNTWKKIYWPDYACLWYFSAKCKANELLKNNDYDAIITVSHPFTGHLVGHSLNKTHSTPWIIDVGDPFCFLESTPNNNLKLYHNINYAAEQKIFAASDAVAVTTQATLDRYADIFPTCKKKLYVIPPLLSLPYIHNTSVDTFNLNRKIKLVFVGTLYKTIRSPEFLLNIFSRLLDTGLRDKLELHLWGNIDDCAGSFIPYNKLIGSKIFLHNQVSREDIANVMADADLLINIGNGTAYQLPSKVVEYANTRKPILNIIKFNDDSSKEFYTRYPAAITVMETEHPDSRDIEKITKLIEKPPAMNKFLIEEWISSFRVLGIAKTYENLVESVSNKGS